MTSGNGGNGDRIGARLSAVEAEVQEIRELLRETASLQRQTAANIDRLEAAQVQTQQQLDQTQAIANSNARAIQAWETRINQVEEDAEEERSRLRVDLTAVQATLDQTAGLQQTLLNVQIQDRQEWRQQREEWREQRREISQQIQTLIDVQNQDRQQWQQQRAEISQQIQSLIDLSRQNTQAHGEFRTDIRHIWERLDE